MLVTSTDLLYVAANRFGKAVFTEADIMQGEEIYQFTGEYLTFAQCKAMGKNESYGLQVERNKYVNLETPGRYINHSCNPNCGVTPGLQLIALRDIKAGEELFYDYSTTMLERSWIMRCECGAPQCRHLVKDFDTLPAALQKKYIHLSVVQSFILQHLNKKRLL